MFTIIFLLFAQLARAGIEMTLSVERCHPGDLIELRTTMIVADYAKFELQIPQHEDLLLVAKERGNVTLTDGQYIQESIWQLQAVRSGKIHIQGIQAHIQRSNGSSVDKLSDLTLEVVPYPQDDESYAPLPIACLRRE
ncbi:hypothetical protein QEH59_09910 [Coraliomargarita sp. SDUM461004]|uniref:Uncharacterized protein n=1 Tax=Thalassobacterium sedimentorum TaxID=3041258 RepID=A0ABU1ALL1_9BACT|nr:hypothetical protein [Coraliomargarita sp. SDUM461004]MDQ8194740.1 hypothetical protein [Coraliomargarita sp. SDUM461004]